MKNKHRLELGLGTTGVFAIAIGISILMVIIWFAVTGGGGSGGSSDTGQTDSYDGWASYSTSAVGLSLKHPSDWTVELDPKKSCTNNAILNVQPPEELAKKAASSIAVDGKGDWKYSVTIMQVGRPTKECPIQNQPIKGKRVGYMKTIDQIKSGVFLDGYITLVSEAEESDLPNAGIVTTKEYASGRTLGDVATFTHNEKPFRVGMKLDPVAGGDVKSVSFKPDEFKNTELYKQSKMILESLE